jgi:hypothetical protein
VLLKGTDAQIYSGKVSLLPFQTAELNLSSFEDRIIVKNGSSKIAVGNIEY